MSKTAASFLTLTLASVLLVLLGPDSGLWNVAGKSAAALFGLLFFLALVVGRKIKFDPVLR